MKIKVLKLVLSFVVMLMIWAGVVPATQASANNQTFEQIPIQELFVQESLSTSSELADNEGMLDDSNLPLSSEDPSNNPISTEVIEEIPDDYLEQVPDSTDEFLNTPPIEIQNGSFEIQAIPKLYPGTKDYMQIGDILYSSKSIGGTAAIVGHVGIVNANYNIVHVTLPVNGGVQDSITTYITRHNPEETIKVYRPNSGMGVAAARWATANYSKVKKYSINPIVAKVGDITPNYCSKFIWQAFWFGEGRNINRVGTTANSIHAVTPSQIATSDYVNLYTSFKAN